MARDQRVARERAANPRRGLHESRESRGESCCEIQNEIYGDPREELRALQSEVETYVQWRAFIVLGVVTIVSLFFAIVGAIDGLQAQQNLYNHGVKQPFKVQLPWEWRIVAGGIGPLLAAVSLILVLVELREADTASRRVHPGPLVREMGRRGQGMASTTGAELLLGPMRARVARQRGLRALVAVLSPLGLWIGGVALAPPRAPVVAWVAGVLSGIALSGGLLGRCRAFWCMVVSVVCGLVCGMVGIWNWGALDDGIAILLVLLPAIGAPLVGYWFVSISETKERYGGRKEGGGSFNQRRRLVGSGASGASGFGTGGGGGGGAAGGGGMEDGGDNDLVSQVHSLHGHGAHRDSGGSGIGTGVPVQKTLEKLRELADGSNDTEMKSAVEQLASQLARRHPLVPDFRSVVSSAYGSTPSQQSVVEYTRRQLNLPKLRKDGSGGAGDVGDGARKRSSSPRVTGRGDAKASRAGPRLSFLGPSGRQSSAPVEIAEGRIRMFGGGGSRRKAKSSGRAGRWSVVGLITTQPLQPPPIAPSVPASQSLRRKLPGDGGVRRDWDDEEDEVSVPPDAPIPTPLLASDRRLSNVALSSEGEGVPLKAQPTTSQEHDGGVHGSGEEARGPLLHPWRGRKRSSSAAHPRRRSADDVVESDEGSTIILDEGPVPGNGGSGEQSSSRNKHTNSSSMRSFRTRASIQMDPETLVWLREMVAPWEETRRSSGNGSTAILRGDSGMTERVGEDGSELEEEGGEEGDDGGSGKEDETRPVEGVKSPTTKHGGEVRFAKGVTRGITSSPPSPTSASSYPPVYEMGEDGVMRKVGVKASVFPVSPSSSSPRSPQSSSLSSPYLGRNAALMVFPSEAMPVAPIISASDDRKLDIELMQVQVRAAMAAREWRKRQRGRHSSREEARGSEGDGEGGGAVGDGRGEGEDDSDVGIPHGRRSGIGAEVVQFDAVAARKVLNTLHTANFDADALSRATAAQPLLAVSIEVTGRWNLASLLPISEHPFHLWVKMIERGYDPSNPYHYATHAADVVGSVCRLLAHIRSPHAECALRCSPMDLFALLVAAIIHDHGHPGLSNGYLVRSSHSLALIYNDKAPLESFHTASAFHLMRDPRLSFIHTDPTILPTPSPSPPPQTPMPQPPPLSPSASDMSHSSQSDADVNSVATSVAEHAAWKKRATTASHQEPSTATASHISEDMLDRKHKPLPPLTLDEWKDFRASVVDLVLATDLSEHLNILSRFGTANASSMSATTASKDDISIASVEEGGEEEEDEEEEDEERGGSGEDDESDGDEKEERRKLLHRKTLGASPKIPDRAFGQLARQVLLKCADIGHASRPPWLHRRWASRIVEEMWREGDLRQSQGLEVIQVMDRSARHLLPRSQAGFLRVVAAPLFSAWENFSGDGTPRGQVEANASYWDSLTLRNVSVPQSYIDGVSPPPRFGSLRRKKTGEKPSTPDLRRTVSLHVKHKDMPTRPPSSSSSTSSDKDSPKEGSTPGKSGGGAMARASDGVLGGSKSFHTSRARKAASSMDATPESPGIRSAIASRPRKDMDPTRKTRFRDIPDSSRSSDDPATKQGSGSGMAPPTKATLDLASLDSFSLGPVASDAVAAQTSFADSLLTAMAGGRRLEQLHESFEPVRSTSWRVRAAGFEQRSHPPPPIMRRRHTRRADVSDEGGEETKQPSNDFTSSIVSSSHDIPQSPFPSTPQRSRAHSDAVASPKSPTHRRSTLEPKIAPTLPTKEEQTKAPPTSGVAGSKFF